MIHMGIHIRRSFPQKEWSVVNTRDTLMSPSISLMKNSTELTENLGVRGRAARPSLGKTEV